MNNETLYSVKELKSRLGVSRQAICLWIKAGRLEAYKAGRAYRITESALKEFLTEWRRGK